MVDACDPDANIQDLRQLIKLNTGVDIKLTKKEICEAYDQIQEGKLPLPPMVMNSTRTYLVDKKSPLNPNDYEKLFDSTTKRADLKRIARKVGLKNVEQMTKMQITDAIGKRLRYMKVHEPVKFARRIQVSVTKNTAVNTNVNNTAVNGYNTNINSAMNNTNRINNNFNKVNNTAVNNTAVNTNLNRVNNVEVNRVNNTGINRANTTVNRVNTNYNRINTTVNRVNTNYNRMNTRVNRPQNKPSKVTFPKGGLFGRGEKPKFLGGVKSAIKPARVNVNRGGNNMSKPVQPKKKGFFAGLFGGGKKEEKNFIAANKFGGSKQGYVFRKGEKGLGYYLNTGKVQGPQLPQYTEEPSKPTPTVPVKPVIEEKRDVFRKILLDYPLNKQDKETLVGQITETTNVNSMKRLANDLVTKRKSEKKEIIIQNLLSFLKPLDIPQSNKNNIARKAQNANANINALKREAINIQTKIQSDGLEDAKQRLIARLTPLNLSQTNQNSIMKKFELGNRNVNKLVEEAKQLKSLRNKEEINTKRKEYGSFLNTLQDLTPEDKQRLLNNGNFNRNRALTLAKNRAAQAKVAQRNNFSTFLNQLGLVEQDKTDMLKLFNSNTLTINALKKKATNLKNSRISEKKLENRNALKKNLENATNLENDIKVDIMKRFEAGESNLVTLRAEITQLVQGIKTARLTNKKQKLAKNVQNSILSQINKNAFIRKLNDPNLNINSLRVELNNMIKSSVESQRSKDRNELEQYMISKKMSNTNRNAILSKFNANTRISLNALKEEANTLLRERFVAQRTENVSNLNAYGRKLGLNNATISKLINKLNSESLDSLKAEADKIAKDITNMKNEREQLNKYMNNIGLNNNNRKNVLNQKLPLNDAKRFANNLLQKKIAEKRNKNKAALAIVLNRLKIANNNRGQFFNNLNKGVNVRVIEQNAINFVKQKNAITKGYQKQDLLAHLSELKLNNAEQQQFINDFNSNTSNLNNIKKRASNFAKKSANAKRAAEREELYQYVNSINLNVKDRNVIMAQFNKTNTNLTTMKEKANSLKKIQESEKLIVNRSELEKYMRKTLKLSQTNINTILAKFNAGEGTLLSLKTNAEQLSTQRKDEKRLANRNELLAYFKEIGLSEENGKSVLNKFNGATIGLKTARKEASTLVKTLIKQKRSQNRRELVQFMNTLQNINDASKKKILKEYDRETANLNTLKNKASQVNQAIRNEKERFNKQQENAKRKREEEAEKKLEQDLETLSSELQKLTNLTNENRIKYLNSLKQRPTTFNLVLKQAKNANGAVKKRKALIEEENRRKRESNKKKAEEARKSRNQMTKDLAESLQTLSTLTRENRKKFMARLPQNNPQLILKNAVNLNDERKAKAKAEENARLAEERKKAGEKEIKSKSEQNMKNVSIELQKLTNLTKNNRRAYIEKLKTTGKNTIIMEAKSEDARRKREKEKTRLAQEEEIKKRRQEKENARKIANEERKGRNTQTKNVATTLQGLKYLKRENRKKFMNRLPKNGANKVIANATKLDKERMEDEASTRRGIEWKLKKIGVTGSDLQGLLKRWDDSKNKTIFDEARKIVAKKREPLLARIKRNVPASNNFSQAQQKWSAAIREATDDASLQKIQRLLDTKLKLKARTEAEIKSLPPREQTRYLKNFMAYKNDVAQRTQELNKLVKTKRDAKNTGTREIATKLQSFNKLERQNRQSFMNRVAKGENSKLVLRNAEKLQRNRTAAARLEAERKAREERERQQAREREERERKQREYEKQKQTKLRANTAKMLQGMSGLERSNRKEFMTRLNRGNDPARVISNARARNQKARSRPKTGPQPGPAQQPKGRVAGKTKKMKAKNRARIPTAKPSYGSKQRRR